jgi:methylphosphotriester-DNA--protein-cysteine methyltransferase
VNIKTNTKGIIIGGEMNKRQAKKQFKKRYGMTPKQAEMVDWEMIGRNLKEAARVAGEAMRAVLIQFAETTRVLAKTMEERPDLIIKFYNATDEEEKKQIVQEIQEYQSNNK